MSPRRRFLLPLLLALGMALPPAMPSCVSAPPPEYIRTPEVVQKRRDLYKELLLLLPTEQRALPEARKEAAWLADTSYKAAAGIARINKPVLAGWLNNRLVNSSFHFKERGLCWHYQHDMYRELRRRSLNYFRIGCCVRDHGKGSEHNCVYLCPAQASWPHVVILDAWRYHGKLKVMNRKDFAKDAWEDSPDSARYLAGVYTECHSYPIEHWARVRSDYSWKKYLHSWTPEGTSSRQGMLMQQNIYRGLQARHGRLTNY